MATVTNISDFRKKDLSKFKDGNYDVNKTIKCIEASDEDAYNMWQRIQEDKQRKGLDRIW